MEKKSDSLLIIFYRNPEKGKVKTRLAATMGDDNALTIYIKLVEHTKLITQNINIDKVIYYSTHINQQDSWNNNTYHKAVQSGDDLGEKMQYAFEKGFASGYESICIIGTDCYELTTEIIETAFKNIKTNNAVIGPALDGGYYLLGANKLYKEFFTNKMWSTESVSRSTIQDFIKLNLKYFELPTLRDVDYEDDLPVNFI